MAKVDGVGAVGVAGDFLEFLWSSFLLLSPMLLLGLFLSGLIHVFASPQAILRWFRGDGLRSVATSAGFRQVCWAARRWLLGLGEAEPGPDCPAVVRRVLRLGETWRRQSRGRRLAGSRWPR